MFVLILKLYFKNYRIKKNLIGDLISFNDRIHTVANFDLLS